MKNIKHLRKSANYVGYVSDCMIKISNTHTVTFWMFSFLLHVFWSFSREKNVFSDEFSTFENTIVRLIVYLGQAVATSGNVCLAWLFLSHKPFPYQGKGFHLNDSLM